MDGFNEKKWFVYFGDHHEGPFSLSDIQDRMSMGQISAANFVWSEGMADWKVMSEVPAFSAAFATPPPSAYPSQAMSANPGPRVLDEIDVPSSLIEKDPTAYQQRTMDPGLEFQVETEAEGSLSRKAAPSVSKAAHRPNGIGNGSGNGNDGAQPQAYATTIGAQRRNPQPTIPAAEVNEVLWVDEEALKQERRARRGRILGRLFFLIALLGGAGYAASQGYLDPVLNSPGGQAAVQTARETLQPWLLKLAEKFPVLEKWVSPIPFLEDVSPEDYEELKKAVAKSDLPGPQLAVALSQPDPTSPMFYVSSNLPDGARIDVYVEGIPDTLLNQLSYSVRTQAIIARKFGKTSPIKFPEGKPLNRGQYLIFALESEDQPANVKALLNALPSSNALATAQVSNALPKGFKLLARKTYFLGGKKDATYTARLKEYHDKLAAKAAHELSEVKQFTMTLEGQLASTIAKFKQLASVRPSLQRRRNWDDFNLQWTRLQGQLNESLAKWTPEALQNEYFYGVLYQLILQSGPAIEKVHQVHHTFFTTTVDPKVFEIQLGQVLSTAQTAITSLKAKVEQAEKIPPTPNGMPRREGL